MPDKRTHRGQHPKDAKLFSPAAIAGLRQAVGDFSLLLSRGYAEKSALKLVGDRFSLTERQRVAIMRSACSEQQLELRKQREVKIADCANQAIAVDGYNVLITVEAAISAGVILKCRDGCVKDLASVHGTYRKVVETIPAVELIAEFMKQAGITDVLWLLDSPVSNSGRLKTLIGKLAERSDWHWQVKLSINPDGELSTTERIAATSDGIVLDKCGRWINLAAGIIEAKLPSVEIIDLSSVC